MKILFHRNFNRSYKKLPSRAKERFKERLLLFANNPFDPLLNNHNLHGKWQDYRSINISGEVRAIYKNINKTEVEFVLLDTHGNLY